MVSITGMRESFDKRLSGTIAESVIIYPLATGSYNARGDLLVSGTNYYVSGGSALAFIFPLGYERQRMLEAKGERIEGKMVGFFSNNDVIGMNYRISTGSEHYEVVSFNKLPSQTNPVYQEVILNKISDN